MDTHGEGGSPTVDSIVGLFYMPFDGVDAGTDNIPATATGGFVLDVASPRA
ncbi:MAG: hypothetical protein KKI02_05410 [Planctomycetes bacterium]|nr:hypothetical protein [Planctomycetota bacterium]